MDSIAPLFNECMRQRLYQESLKAISRNDASQSVSLNRLARIFSVIADSTVDVKYTSMLTHAYLCLCLHIYIYIYLCI